MEQNNSRLVPGVGRLPYPAYRGKEPYVFVSYAHADAEIVFEEIRRFNEAGFHVWYDEGIAPGNEWTDEIADALLGCTVFVVMITPTSAPRENVLNEIYFALDEKKPFLAIHLEETELKGGLRLRTGSKQAIPKYKMTEEEYVFKFTEAFTRFGLKADAPAVKTSSDAEDRTPAGSLMSSSAASTAPSAAPAPAVSTKSLDELAARVAKMYEKKDAPAGSPAEAQKNAFNRITDVSGFRIQGGLLKSYTGKEKDLVLPPSVTVLSAVSFQECRDFIESVDLNNVSVITSGAFTNCPNLHTVKASRNLKPIYAHVFQNCPNVTLYIKRSQVAEGFEDNFCGKEIIYLDE